MKYVKYVVALILGWGMWTGLRIIAPGVSDDRVCYNTEIHTIFKLALSCWAG